MPEHLDRQLDAVLLALVGVDSDRYDPVVVLEAVERRGKGSGPADALIGRLDALLAAGAEGREVDGGR